MSRINVSSYPSFDNYSPVLSPVLRLKLSLHGCTPIQVLCEKVNNKRLYQYLKVRLALEESLLFLLYFPVLFFPLVFLRIETIVRLSHRSSFGFSLLCHSNIFINMTVIIPPMAKHTRPWHNSLQENISSFFTS